MKIRAYEYGDEKSVLSLWHKSGLIVPQNDPLKDVQRKLKVNPEWFLVGELAGEIIATCMAGYDGHRGWIYYLMVDPDLQGRGYGRQIMQRAEELLKEAGCPKINLQIRTSNKKALSFYKSIGYDLDEVFSMGKRLIED
jgi:ribosomal protein S18 acetylase RimI-like enzyme